MAGDPPTSMVYFDTPDIVHMTYVAGSLVTSTGENWPDPEPLPTQTGWQIAVTCDLSNQTPTADSFNEAVASTNNLWGSHSGGSRPAQLNFWFKVLVFFQAPTSTGSFSTEILIGQGHKKSGDNWWIGGPAICNGAHDKTIVCMNDVAFVEQVLTLDSASVDRYELAAWFPQATSPTVRAGTALAAAPTPVGTPAVGVMSLTSSYISNVTYIPDSLTCLTVVTDGPSVTPPGQGQTTWTVTLQTDPEPSSQVALDFSSLMASANRVLGPSSEAPWPETLDFYFGLQVDFTIGDRTLPIFLYFAQESATGVSSQWWVGGTSVGSNGADGLIAFGEPGSAVLQVLAIDVLNDSDFVLDAYWNSVQEPPDESAWIGELKLDDDMSIGQVSLPGTHGSAAFGGWPLWNNQALSLSQQFKAGVRMFDIRIAVTQPEADGPYVFDTCHGDVGRSSGANRFEPLVDALQELSDCLPDGTSEFMVMMVKVDDHGDFLEYKYLTPLEDLLGEFPKLMWSASLPTVGQARGKIFVISRIQSLGASYLGYDNVSGELFPATGGRSFSVYVQDQYEKYDGTPETVKMGVYEAAVSGGATADVLINFASGTQGVGNLSGVYIDNLILAWLGASPGGTRLARLGWTLHDFVETDYDTIPYGAMSIIQLVIDSNNHHYGHYSKMFSVGWPPPPTLRRVQKLRRRQAWLSATEDVPEGSP